MALLIDHDPAAAAKDALLIATAAVNGSKKILAQLHKIHADLDQIDKYGWTPLLLARQFKHVEAEDFLSMQTKPTCWEMEGVEMKVSDDSCGLEHIGGCKFAPN